MAKSKLAKSVRICRLEVSKVSGDWKDTTRRWHELRHSMQQLANCIWQTWLVWHAEHGSAAKLREWLDSRAANGIDAAGKCPVEAVGKELSRRIYNTIRERFPGHSRPQTLLQQRIVMGIGARKAARGSLPGWSSILLCNESLPSFTRGLPVLFDSHNSELSFQDGTPLLTLRTSMDPAFKRKSIEDVVTLWHGGRSVRSQVDIFRRIVSGEFRFCGSSLTYDETRKKWFALISYQRPSHVQQGLDVGKTAYLFPGRTVPFVFRIPGESRWTWLQGRGRHIEAIRRRVFAERRERSEHYRKATSRKGKGRDHAQRWRQQLSRKWSEFVRRVNHAVAHDAVQRCIANGVGTLVYLKPSGAVASHRAVSTLGSTPHDQSSWEFFQLKTMLAYKCQDAGITFLCVEFDGSRSLGSGSDKRGEAA